MFVTRANCGRYDASTCVTTTTVYPVMPLLTTRHSLLVMNKRGVTDKRPADVATGQ